MPEGGVDRIRAREPVADGIAVTIGIEDVEGLTLCTGGAAPGRKESERVDAGTGRSNGNVGEERDAM